MPITVHCSFGWADNEEIKLFLISHVHFGKSLCAKMGLVSKDEDDDSDSQRVSAGELCQPVKELKEKWKLVPAFLAIKGLVKQVSLPDGLIPDPL